MEEVKSLGLIYDVLQDEWVLDLLTSFSSTNESTPSNNNSSNAPSTPTSYESCHYDSPVSTSSSSSPLPSPLQSSLPCSNKYNCYSKSKKSSTRKGRASLSMSSSSSSKVPYLVHLAMCHGHGKLWHAVKYSCMGCFKANNNKKQSKCKGICSDINISRVLVHKRKGSDEIKEEDLKEAIDFCKRSAAFS